jgi:signal-transduction protein with cAMP-binding, CBS, and nucleotidyltransferase domain
MLVQDLTCKPPVTIEASARITQAARLMDEQVVGAVVVVDHGRPVGIVTDRDLAVRAVAQRVPPDARVDDVMSTDLVWVGPEQPVGAALEIFRERDIRRLPVIDGGRMVGMFTVDDLMIRLVNDLEDLMAPVTGQVVFGHPEAKVPVPG